MSAKKANETPGPRIRNKGIRKVRVADLVDAEVNVNSHPNEQAAALDGAIDELGFHGYPLCYELPDGRIGLYDGHLRKARLIEKFGPDVEIEVAVADFSEAEAKKAMLTTDPLARMAEIDAEALDELLREVETGNEALAAMLTELAEDNGILDDVSGEVTEDEVPEPPAVPVSRLGDVYTLGQHRLICGDSTNAAVVGRLLNGTVPFLMVTDPPYGVEYDANWRNEYDLPGSRSK